MLAGSLVSALESTIAAIIVSRLLGPGDYGLLGLTLAASGILQLFVGLGVTTAVTRYVAFYVSQGDPERALRFGKNAIVFTLLTGVALAAFAFVAAGPIASLLLHRPSLAPYVELVSVMLVGQALLQSSLGAAMGWYSMGIASESNVVQSFVRMVLSPVLILAGYGLAGAVLGYASSFVIGGLFSMIVLYAYRLRPKSNSMHTFLADSREMVKYGRLVFVGGVLSGLSVSYYLPLVLAAIASNSTIGYFQAASGVTIPVSLLTSTTGAALLPAFASLHGVQGDIAGAVKRATRYVSYVAIPTIFFLIVCARQLVDILYGAQYAPGTDYLVLLSISALPILIGSSVVPTFFNGVGKPRTGMYAVASGALVLFVLAPLLAITAGLGVDGAIYALLVSNLVTGAVGLAFVRRQFSSSIEWRKAALVLIGSLGAFAIAYLVPAFTYNGLTLAARLVVFGAVYFTVAPALGAIDEVDLDIIQSGLGEMRLVGRVASPLIGYQRYFARFGRSDKTPTSG